MAFPIIEMTDFESDFTNISKRIFQASQEWGFFILKDHGIKEIDVMFELSRQFFDLPMDAKTEKVLNDDPVGYDGHKATTFAASEGMAFGLPAGELCKSDNIHAWWDSSRLEVIERFKLQCNELTLKILSCFAVCMRLPRDFLAESHQQVLPGNTLKLIKYPKLATQPVSEIPRLSEHTDWGSLTLLFTESPGLELRDPSNQWHDVPLVPGGVVVNIGDALSLWTNKELKSTMHRISWKNLPIDRDRYSIPYFVHPNFATNLQPLTAPVKTEQRILYKDYYNVRLKLTWGSLTKADGEEIFNNSEKDVIKYLQALGVANAGALESNSLPETQTQEVSLVH